MALPEKRIRESFSLKTDDIAGAKPFLKSYQYTNKPDFTNSTTGISKSSPHLQNLQTNRHVNPLVPEYKLPTSQERPYTPPKFIRNSMDMSDIKGTTPSSLYRNMLRNTLDVSDISTARSLDPRNTRRSTRKESEVDGNISGRSTRFQTRRNTNPLNPAYDVAGVDGYVVKHGEIAGNAPRTLVNVKKPPHTRILDVKDIQGSPCTNSFITNEETTFRKPVLKLSAYVASKLEGDISRNVTISSGNSSGYHSPRVKFDNSFTKSPSLNSLNSSGSLGNDSLRGSFELKNNSKKQVQTPSRIKKRPLPRSPMFSPRTKND